MKLTLTLVALAALASARPADDKGYNVKREDRRCDRYSWDHWYCQPDPPKCPDAKCPDPVTCPEAAPVDEHACDPFINQKSCDKFVTSDACNTKFPIDTKNVCTQDICHDQYPDDLDKLCTDQVCNDKHPADPAKVCTDETCDQLHPPDLGKLCTDKVCDPFVTPQACERYPPDLDQLCTDQVCNEKHPADPEKVCTDDTCNRLHPADPEKVCTDETCDKLHPPDLGKLCTEEVCDPFVTPQACERYPPDLGKLCTDKVCDPFVTPEACHRYVPDICPDCPTAKDLCTEDACKDQCHGCPEPNATACHDVCINEVCEKCKDCPDPDMDKLCPTCDKTKFCDKCTDPDMDKLCPTCDKTKFCDKCTDPDMDKLCPTCDKTKFCGKDDHGGTGGGGGDTGGGDSTNTTPVQNAAAHKTAESFIEHIQKGIVSSHRKWMISDRQAEDAANKFIKAVLRNDKIYSLIVDMFSGTGANWPNNTFQAFMARVTSNMRAYKRSGDFNTAYNLVRQHKNEFDYAAAIANSNKNNGQELMIIRLGFDALRKKPGIAGQIDQGTAAVVALECALAISNGRACQDASKKFSW